MCEKDERIRSLTEEIVILTEENKRLEETVQWMHDLIWKMVREREDGKKEE
ncbi:MAG: hypothetical protein HFE83_11055 [Lachnospiraceae bacterium]|jgi:hypothetical protein|nr:hypothetical protein [Lachnospiraceae bacterium]